MLGENVTCVKFLFGRKVLRCGGASWRAGMRPSRAYGQEKRKKKKKQEDEEEEMQKKKKKKQLLLFSLLSLLNFHASLSLYTTINLLLFVLQLILYTSLTHSDLL